AAMRCSSILRSGDSRWVAIRDVTAAVAVHPVEQLRQLFRVHYETRQPPRIELRVVRTARRPTGNEQHDVVFVAHRAPGLRVRPASLPRELALLRPYAQRQREASYVIVRQYGIDRQLTARDL